MFPIARCTLCITALFSLACSGCAQGVAETADEIVPEEFPHIEVPGHKVAWLQTDPQPEPFLGALTYLNEQQHGVEAGRLEFTVKRGGVVLLLASWEDKGEGNGDSRGNWKSEAVTREQLGRTWFDLGPAPWDENRVLLMRECQAGETHSIRTNKDNPPQPILVSGLTLTRLQKGGLSAREALTIALREARKLPVVQKKPPTRSFIPPVHVPEAAAVLDVQEMQPSALVGESIPSYLQGAKIYRRDANEPKGFFPSRGVLRFRVLRGGQVFLLASWKEPLGSRSRESELSYRQLSADWAPLGRCPWDPEHWLFVRECEAGEAFELRTRTASPPLPIVAPPVDLLAEEYADLVPVLLRDYYVKRQIRRLVAEKNYAEIERLASAFRRPGARFPSMNGPLSILYAELLRVEKEDNQHYADLIARLEKWVAASGESLTARVALSGALRYHGSFVRGSALARNVSDRQFEVFREQLVRAEQVLLALDEDAPRDVAYYTERIAIGTGLGASRADVLRWALAAAELDPWNADATFAAVTYFLPRWHGEPGDLVMLAETLTEATRDECGEALYARVVMGVRQLFARRTFVEGDFSWERTRQGLADLRERFPQSQYLLNVQCQLACLAFDRELVKACFAEIGDEPDLRVWGEIGAYEMHRRAFSPENLAGAQDRLWMAHAYGAKYACFSPDGTRLLTSGHDSQIKVWDAATGRELRRQALLGASNCIDFLNDRTIVIGGQLGDLYFWDWVDDEIQRVARLPARIVSLDCSPDGRYLFLADAGATTIVLDLEKQQEVHRGELLHGSFNTGVFSADSRFLATTGGGGGIILHNLEVGRPETTFDKESRFNSVIAFSPDGTHVATGENTGDVKVWRVDGWKLVADTSTPGTYRDRGGVQALSFSPDGEQLVIARGGGIHNEKGGLWILPLDGRSEERRIAGHTSCVHDVDFAPDGKTLLSVGADWTLRLYDAAKLQPQ